MAEIVPTAASPAAAKIGPNAALEQWTQDLGKQLQNVWGREGLARSKVVQLAHRAMITPNAAGVELRELPYEVIQQLLKSRRKAMKELFEAWAKRRKKNPKALLASLDAAMLEAVRLAYQALGIELPSSLDSPIEPEPEKHRSTLPTANAPYEDAFIANPNKNALPVRPKGKL